MKKWKPILAAFLCLLFVQGPLLSETAAVQVQAAAVKSGLKKEGGKYFYYVNGKKVKNVWKNIQVTSNGKKVTRRCYFGKDGAAYAGKKVGGVTQPAVKKISGAYYAFDSYGRMMKGTYVINGVYRTFSSSTGQMTGLAKENGKYYYYTGTKKAVNVFKTVKIKSSGKVYSYKYYFGKDGAAYQGKKDMFGTAVPAVKKIGSYYYGFNTSARMITGTYVINDKFYAFASNGRLDRTKTNKLRAASKEKANAATLRKLLGKPQKTQYYSSCYGDGKDLLLTYPHFYVSLFKDKKGKEIVLGVMSK